MTTFDPTIDYGLSDLSKEENLVCWKFGELVKTLVTLSSSAERQIEIIGAGCVAEEMAEDFHSYFTISWKQFVDHQLLSEATIDELNDLDIFFDQRSGDNDPNFWEDTALSTNNDWKSVRIRAKDILISLGFDDLDIVFERTEKYKQSNEGEKLLIQTTRTRLVKKLTALKEELNTYTIVDLIIDYQENIQRVMDAFEQEFNRTDLLTAYRHDKIYPQIGKLDKYGIKRYAFHGIGLSVDFKDNTSVDFDFAFFPEQRHDGFDLWRLGEFVFSRSNKYQKYLNKDKLEEDFNQLIALQLIAKPNINPSTTLYFFQSSLKKTSLTTKQYVLFLDNTIIGTTKLENADAPMGVVFGQINFINNSFGYDFFRNYCLQNDIELAYDYPEDKLIATRTIKNLVIKNNNGVEIVGLGNQISGMDNDKFEITLEGIAYPFFEEEFPHHVKAYNDQFNEKTNTKKNC